MLEKVWCLLEYLNKAKHEDVSKNANEVSANGETPLYVACKLGHKDVVKVLLNRKMNPYVKVNVAKKTKRHR